MAEEAPNSKSMKRKIIPKSISSRIVEMFRVYIESIQSSVSSTDTVLTIFLIYIAVQASLPAFLPLSSKIWPSDTNIHTIITDISILWRFCQRESISSSFSLHAILTLAIVGGIFIFVAIMGLVFIKKFYLHKAVMVVMLFYVEIGLPVGIFSIPTPIAIILYEVCTSASYRSNASMYIFLVLLIALYALLTLFLRHIVFNQVVFSNGRSMTWLGNSLANIIDLSALNVLITRFVELSYGAARYVFISISIIVCTYLAVTTILRHPFIKSVHASIFVSMLIAGISVLLLDVIVFIGVSIQPEVLVTVFIIVFVLVYSFYFPYLNNEAAKCLFALDQLEAGTITFSDAFKTPNQFLVASRIGFQRANRYILTWQPMYAALEKWEKNPKLWMQFLRYLSVFYSENSTLINVRSQCKEKIKKGFAVKFFLKRVEHIIESRDHRLTKEVKIRLQNIETMTRSLRTSLVAMWSSIEKQQSAVSFDKTIKCYSLSDEIKAEYRDLLATYPNKPSICTHYSNFLLEIICNPEEAIQMRNHAQSFQISEDYFIDTTQASGLALFPYLPQNLKAVKPSEKDKAISIDDSTSKTSTQIPEDDSIDKSPSMVYNLGQRAPMRHATIVIIAVISIFVISFAIGVYIPAMFTNSGYSSTVALFNGYTSLNKFESTLFSTEFFLVCESLLQNGVWPSPMELASNVTGSSYGNSSYSSYIKSGISALDTAASTFLSAIGSDIPYSSTGGNYLRTLSIPLQDVVLANGSTTINTFNGSFADSINAILGYFHQYSSEESNLSQMVWLSSIIKNMNAIEVALNLSSLYINEDVISSVKNIDNNTLIIICCVSALSMVVLLIAIESVIMYRKKWSIFMKASSSLPSIIIRRTIEKFQYGNDNVHSNDDGKTMEMMTKIESTTDNDEGQSSITIYGFAFTTVVSIAGLIIIYFLSVSYSDSMKVTSVIDLTNNNLATSVFTILSRDLLYLSSNLSHPIIAVDNSLVVTRLRTSYSGAVEAMNDYYSNVKDGEQGGMLSRNSSIVKNCLTYKSFYNYTNHYLAWVKLPSSLMIDVAMSKLLSSTELVLATPIQELLPSNQELLDATYEFAIYLNPYLFTIMATYDSEAMESTLSTVVSNSVVTPSIVLSVGFILCFVVLMIIIRGNSTFRFALTSLSMLSGKTVLNSSAFLEVLSGTYKENYSEETVHSIVFNEAMQKVEDRVIVVDRDLYVSTINSSMESELSSSLSVANAHVSTQVTFNEDRVFDDLSDALAQKDCRNKVGQYNCEMEITENGERFEVEVDTFVTNVPTGRRKGILLIRKKKAKNDENAIENEEKSIKALLSIGIPKRLQQMIDVSSKIYRVTVSNVIIGVIHTKDVKAVRSAVEEEISLTDDGVLARCYGSSLVFLLNSISHLTNFRKLYTQALEFISKVNHRIPGKKFGVCFGLARNAVIGVNEESFGDFQIYSKNMAMIMITAKHTFEGEVSFPHEIYEHLQASEIAKCREFASRNAAFQEKAMYLMPIPE